MIEDGFSMCESPIEIKFLIRANERGLFPEPQWIVETYFGPAKYRVDFAFVDEKIAIELDGHEFHASKEQRMHDAQKERALLFEGWKTVRFTGSEIHRDIDKCIEEIVFILYKLHEYEDCPA